MDLEKWKEEIRPYLFGKLEELWELFVNGKASAKTIWEWVDQFPSFPWDYEKLSEHPAFSWEVLDRHIDHSWDWEYLSRRNDLQFEVVHRHAHKNWNWRILSEHPAVTLDHIRDHPNHFWYFKKRKVPAEILFQCPNYQRRMSDLSEMIPLEVILETPDKSWDWKVISRRPIYPDDKHLFWEIVDQLIDKPWDWNVLSAKPELEWSFVEKHLEKPWNWKVFSESKEICWEFVVRTKEYPWNWYHLSLKKDIPIEIIKQIPSHWNWNMIIRNHDPPKKWDYMRELPEGKWEYHKYSHQIPWDIVQKYPNRKWNWYILSKREDIVWDFVYQHPELPWNWYFLEKNSSLSWKFVAQHPQLPWPREILYKRFEKETVMVIQKWWLRVYYDPASAVCQRRLRRDCEALNELTRNTIF